MAFLNKIVKLAVALVFAAAVALSFGFVVERVIASLVPKIYPGAGHVIKAVVFVISLPICFYLVESYFIRKEKGR
ncbi:MAG: hypothetical protein GTN70_09260 [Deltaproteobacteria bacterium]|nr:hypothetical protein [Deltaproteobacteria bacterium]NIS77965.1 hypothetical protein [Deltaproteobacteria bacterium]